MLTPLATPLAIGLLAVTFGWNPAQPTAGQAEADTYEYELRLSEADLEALRNGRVDSLTSELPRDLVGIERVRITFGSGTPRRVLTRRDQQSPRRIAAASEPQPHVVAKPVVTPEWDDAAKLVTNLSPNAEQWTVRQGQGAFGPGGLADEIRNGAQRTGQFLQGQSQNLAEGTQGLLQRGGDAIRNGAQNLVDNTGRLFDNTPPARGGGVFGQRPGFANQTGQQPMPQNNTVAPPAPAAAVGPGFARGQSDQMPFRDQGQPLPQNNQMPQGNPSFAADPAGGQGPQFPAPRFQDDGVVQRFADPGRSTDSRLTPIPRQQPLPARDPYDPFANQRDYAQNPNRVSADPGRSFPTPRRLDESGGNPAVEAFPPRINQVPPANYAARDPGIRDSDRVNYSSAEARPLPVREANVVAAGDLGVRSWLGSGREKAGADASDVEATDSKTEKSARDPDWVQTLMLVFLAGFTVYTWWAYFDMRNRYRMALRGLPGSGYHPAI